MVSAPQFTRGYCRCITVQLSAIWSKVDIVFTMFFLWKCSVQGASSSFLYIVSRYWPIFLVLVSSLPVYWLLWLEPMLPVANHVVFHETLPSQVWSYHIRILPYYLVLAVTTWTIYILCLLNQRVLFGGFNKFAHILDKKRYHAFLSFISMTCPSMGLKQNM